MWWLSMLGLAIVGTTQWHCESNPSAQDVCHDLPQPWLPVVRVLYPLIQRFSKILPPARWGQREPLTKENVSQVASQQAICVPT